MTSRSIRQCLIVIASSCSACKTVGAQGREVPIENLLILPGVVNEKLSDPSVAEADWPIIERTLVAALDQLSKMRRDEGHAMAADLAANCRSIAAVLKQIATRTHWSSMPFVARLTERIRDRTG